MKQLRRLIVISLTAASLLVHGAGFTSTAQEATPQPVEADLSTFNTSLIGLLPGVALPAAADIVAVRSEFAPGVMVPFTAGADSAATLIIVERGELTITVTNQPWSISRESVLNQAMASPTVDGDLFKLSSIIEPGDEGKLGVGDMTLIPATADGEMRNATLEPVTALTILMGPSMTAAATPTP